ncbi:MAG: hypothetical protein GY913_00900 [Proteobacteria bacterium]|nr:hypothetical protein [Pseudomonadota bacterium]MCP4915455.1 hypothetical protein [Pseudomonadota bacterium]
MTLFVLALANAAELRSDMTRISPEEVYVMTCATAVEDAGSDHQKVIDLWVACDTEAVRRELDGARPFIRGQIAMSEIARDYSRLAAEDPLEYARVVLAVSAQRRDAALPFDDVQAAWLRVMQDSEARMNVEDVRSVTIRWLPAATGTEPQRAILDELVRKHIADMGFKIRPGDDADSAEAAVMIFVEPVFRVAQEGDPSRGKLHGSEVELKSQPVRYRDRDAKGAPLRVTERADYRDKDEAIRTATDAAARAFAEQLLVQVVREVYTDYELPVARRL